MIRGDENLLQIREQSENLLPLFEKQGLGSYFKEENLQKIGRFTRLNTLLQAKKIDAQSFIARLNEVLASEESVVKSMQQQEDLHFAAMLPCGLRNPFKEFAESYFNQEQGLFQQLNYLIEGNVNHELSYYPLLDTISDERELPDVIMASDVNNFFHKPFWERFVDTGVFETYTPYTPHAYLEKAGYADPDRHFTMYTANLLVMVVDKERLGDRPMPTCWDDLLSPHWQNDIIMRGEDNFFCNAVMLPFYKDKGMEAIPVLAENIKSGLHPAEMVKLAGSGKAEGAAVYIMPYFFSKRIKHPSVEVVWPTDGAIVSPVFLLAKKSKLAENKALLDFLLSKETAEMMYGRHFPVIHPEVNHEHLPQAVKWLGWDFLKGHDIGQLKEDIRTAFMKVWELKMQEKEGAEA